MLMKIMGDETENEIVTELGMRIKRYRIFLGLTQKMVSEQSGVSIKTVAKVKLWGTTIGYLYMQESGLVGFQ